METQTLQNQTRAVIHGLLHDERHLDTVEPDGPEKENRFDPVAVGHRLRALGDDYEERVIGPLVENLHKAAADQLVCVFGDAVDRLCQTVDGPSEKHLLRAAVTLGLYVKRTSPALSAAVQVAMTSFINHRLIHWVAQQGGWASVSMNSTS